MIPGDEQDRENLPMVRRYSTEYCYSQATQTRECLDCLSVWSSDQDMYCT